MRPSFKNLLNALTVLLLFGYLFGQDTNKVDWNNYQIDQTMFVRWNFTADSGATRTGKAFPMVFYDGNDFSTNPIAGYYSITASNSGEAIDSLEGKLLLGVSYGNGESVKIDTVIVKSTAENDTTLTGNFEFDLVNSDTVKVRGENYFFEFIAETSNVLSGFVEIVIDKPESNR
ncbi:MAG: hypothetical protein PVH88_02105 [Ignavibacteria bacterium]|jgi:hypothetical protein